VESQKTSPELISSARKVLRNDGTSGLRTVEKSMVAFELAHDQNPEEKDLFDSMESHFKSQINLVNAKLELSQRYVRSSVESAFNGESEKRCRVDF
jgi:hypothetical protein